eukprot:5969584-Amphidinium_carterae.1
MPGSKQLRIASVPSHSFRAPLSHSYVIMLPIVVCSLDTLLTLSCSLRLNISLRSILRIAQDAMTGRRA